MRRRLQAYLAPCPCRHGQSVSIDVTIKVGDHARHAADVDGTRWEVLTDVHPLPFIPKSSVFGAVEDYAGMHQVTAQILTFVDSR